VTRPLAAAQAFVHPVVVVRYLSSHTHRPTATVPPVAALPAVTDVSVAVLVDSSVSLPAASRPVDPATSVVVPPTGGSHLLGHIRFRQT
jgi:hypothetical protein